MKKWISLGVISKSLLFNLYMSLSSVSYKYIYGFTYIECFYPMNIYRILYNWIIDENKEDCPRHRVFDTFFSYIGVIIISFLFVKDKKEEKEESQSNIDENKIEQKITALPLIYYKKKEYLDYWKCRIYYILILFLWILEENLVLIYVDIFQDLDFWFFELIFVSFLYSKLFISEIKSHQKIGMAISIIVGSLLKIYNISLTLISGNAFYAKNKGLIAFVILYFAIIFARSYVNTVVKEFFDIKYISLRILLISYGIAGVIILFFTGIFTSCVSCSDDLKDCVCKFDYDDKLYYDEIHNYYESGKNMLVRLIVIFFGMISFFFDKFYSVLIIKNYSPVHVIFSFPMQFFLEKTFLLIFTAIFFREDLFSDDGDLPKFLLDISGDIFSIIGFLIYYEIIELHFCNLDFNLKENISKRSENEIEEIEFIMTGTNSQISDDSSEDEDIVF